jgi:hypothetical protein
VVGSNGGRLDHVLVERLPPRVWVSCLSIFRSCAGGATPFPGVGQLSVYLLIVCCRSDSLPGSGSAVCLSFDRSTRDLFCSQICLAYRHEGGRVVVVLSSRNKLEMEAAFRRTLPECMRFGSRFVFRQVRQRPAKAPLFCLAPPARARHERSARFCSDSSLAAGVGMGHLAMSVYPPFSSLLAVRICPSPCLPAGSPGPMAGVGPCVRLSAALASQGLLLAVWCVFFVYLYALLRHRGRRCSPTSCAS